MHNTESKKDKEYTLNFSIDGKWLADLSGRKAENLFL